MTEHDGQIRLIIKAPNQNIKDHIVHCNLEWTVGELKECLSEEYPNKPNVMEQRLIYSGHLLHNHLFLKDVLRHDESTVHTLHLVCNTNSNAPQESFSSQNWYNQSNAQSTVSNAEALGSSSENILRNRNSSFASPINPVYSLPLFTPSLNSDAQTVAQMTEMQQMYAYYFNQYMQSVNTALSNQPSVLESPNIQPNRLNSNEAPVRRPVNQRLDAAPAVEENDEILANRDWMDHLFLCCRFLVFFCIVYFYSTPERLMIVIVCAIIAFLYHEGWFVRRTRPIAVAADANVRRGDRNNLPAPLNEINEDNEVILVNQDLSANGESQDAHELEAAMDGDDPPHAQNTDRVNNNRIFSPLNIITAFFSSLIPEPPPPVNIN